jgi:hypothetical protein
MSFNVYPARGHAVGYGGNNENRSGGVRRVRVAIGSEDENETRLQPTEIQTARSRFVDQVLAKIALRKELQSANAEESQPANEGQEERQQKRKRAA